jgi:hypothetical protein
LERYETIVQRAGSLCRWLSVSAPASVGSGAGGP